MSNKKIENEQLSFDIKEPLSNRLVPLKRKYEYWQYIIDTKRFIRDPLVWFFIFSCAALLIVQVIHIILKIDLLPSQIPLLKFYPETKDILTNKNFLYSIPMISILSSLFLFYTGYKNYQYDRYMSAVIMLEALVVNVFFTYSTIILIAQYYVVRTN